MAYQKLADLTIKLRQRTLEGKVAWEETPQAGAYHAAFADYTLQISVKPPGPDADGSDFQISVFDGQGRELESFTDTELSKQFSPPNGEPNFSKPMREIHEIARRTALGTEEAIESILSVLDEEGDRPSF